jgi:predicted ATPase/DNA-binding winged helix-turn-helix (wHTH) protein
MPTTTFVAFGPFRFFAVERLLEKDGVPVHVSDRALDILNVLVRRAGEIVTKEELLSQVWPSIAVHESTLRVHIANLRKALGDGRDGARYVANVTGRGYCFVAPITGPAGGGPAATTDVAGASDEMHRLPVRLTPMIGREGIVSEISTQLVIHRLVTIHGPGGIGKTTVATSIGHALLADLAGAVRFFDFGPIDGPHLVSSGLAAILGVPVQCSDPTASLISVLRSQRMLLILDGCEHVIEAAAPLAERIIREAPQVTILATSREALRVEGEHVCRLPGLESPPESVEVRAATLLAYPATRLFVERAAASGHRFEVSDEDAPSIVDMCRKLEGIALAIELAAARVGVHGLRGTAALLDHPLSLLWYGRRTAVPRHQTLNAMFRWSFDLLTGVERTVLRRLSIFVGRFTVEAARAIASGSDLDGAQVTHALWQLVAKSLVSAEAGERATRYRLLDTTRAYTRARLVEAGEGELIARRHAIYFRELLEQASLGDAAYSSSDHLGNVRAALEWSFRQSGDVTLGVALAAASTRLFLDLSLLSECHHWAALALSKLDDSVRGTRFEMELQSAYGLATMITKGNSERSHAALARGLELAEALEDRASQFRLIGRLHLYYRRAGYFGPMCEIARRAEAVAVELGDPDVIAAAHSLLGCSYHLIGNQRPARTYLESALLRAATLSSLCTSRFGFRADRGYVVLARTMWLLGLPSQAARIARRTVDPQGATEPVNFSIALIWGTSVFQWTGDLAGAEDCIERLIAHAARHSLAPYQAVAFGLKGELLIRRGDVSAGIDLLRSSLATLQAVRYELYTTGLNSALSEGLAMTGRLDQALQTIEDTVAAVERNGDLFNMPELLRLRGEFLAQAKDEHAAEACFLRSIELAEEQSALSWQLRTSTSLARLRFRQGRRQEAQRPLAETYSHFSEGFDTDDLKAAKRMLDEIGRPAAGA